MSDICTPEDRHDDDWDVNDDMGRLRDPNFTCGGCGRPATPEETEVEQERLYDASLPEPEPVW